MSCEAGLIKPEHAIYPYLYDIFSVTPYKIHRYSKEMNHESSFDSTRCFYRSLWFGRGMPFTDYVNDSLLRPLDMYHSNFEFDTTGERVSKSYLHGREVQELGLRDLPAGGLVTTVGDLSNLVKLVNANGFYQDSQLLEPETMQEMLAGQAFDSVYEPDGFNGIGWFHFSRFLDNKYTVIGHTGQTMAHSALVAIVPDIQLGVVLPTNSPGNGGLEEIADEILRVSHSVTVRKALSSIAATDKNPNSLYGNETSFDGQYVSSFGYIEPMRNLKLPLAVINDSEATLQGYGRGLGETVFFQPDGSLLHAGWVFVKNQ